MPKQQAFQFKVSKPRPAAAPEPDRPQAETESEKLPEEVQGVPVGSKQEARMAAALNYWKIAYTFQYPIYGGRRVRGGLVVDFVAYTPDPVPIQVHGEYWHGGQRGAFDNLEDAAIERAFKVPPVIFWEDELGSLEAAKSAVREKLL